MHFHHFSQCFLASSKIDWGPPSGPCGASTIFEIAKNNRQQRWKFMQHAWKDLKKHNFTCELLFGPLTIFEIWKISTKVMNMHGKYMKIHEQTFFRYQYLCKNRATNQKSSNIAPKKNQFQLKTSLQAPAAFHTG